VPAGVVVLDHYQDQRALTREQVVMLLFHCDGGFRLVMTCLVASANHAQPQHKTEGWIDWRGGPHRGPVDTSATGPLRDKDHAIEQSVVEAGEDETVECFAE